MIAPPSLGIWLINLDRSQQRRATMETRLARVGLDYTRFPAIDGRAEWDRLVKDVDVASFQRNVGRDVLPGEIGCYQSHLGVWRSFLDSPHEVALVLEDDVVFHDDFRSALDAALSDVEHWDMVKLNCIRAKQPILRRRVGDYKLNAYIGAFTGMGAYLITRRFAAATIMAMTPIRRPIDHELDRFQASSFRHFGLEPFPSHVDDGNQSTITGTGFSSVRRYAWHARLSVYRQRIGKVFRKAHAILMGRDT